MNYPKYKILCSGLLLIALLGCFSVCPGQGLSLSDDIHLKLKGNIHLVISGEQGHISLDSESVLTDVSESTIKLSGNFMSDRPGIGLAGNMIFDGTNAQSLNAGTDLITIGNLEIDNTAGLTIQTPVLINGDITFSNGNITTSATNLLTLESRSTYAAGNANSFVDGPVAIKTLASAGDSYDFVFPTGKGTAYKPIHLKFDQTNTNVTAYQAALTTEPPPTLTPTEPVTSVSAVRYWELNNGESDNFENAEIILPVSEDDGVSDINEVVIAKSEDNTSWNSVGGKEVTIPGTVTSESAFTSLGFFIIGNTGGVTFPAPPAVPISMQDTWLPVADSENPLPRDYQIIALPFTSQPMPSTLSDLGMQTNTKWKIYEYGEDATQDWNNSERARFAKPTQLTPGKGYMFIFRDPTDIQVSGDFVTPNNVSITLTPGFNLIGNPYWFPLDWDAVLDFNSGKAGIEEVASTLKAFRKGTGYTDATVLEPYKGTFVFNSNQSSSVTLDIPAAAICTSCGRYSSEVDRPKPQPLDADAWTVPLHLEGKGLQYTLSGIGMHPKANKSADRFDDFTVPRFLDYLELNFLHPEFFMPKFTKDIVPTQEEYTWEFEVASNLQSPEVTLKWENSYFGNNDQVLMLLDLQNHQTVNMQEDTAYTFSVTEDSRKFKIFYGPTEVVRKNMLPENIVVGNAYPNPVTDQFKIPVILPDGYQHAHIQLEIYDATGSLVKTSRWHNLPTGYNSVGWNIENNEYTGIQPGLYFYRLTISGQTDAYNGRILIR